MQVDGDGDTAGSEGSGPVGQAVAVRDRLGSGTRELLGRLPPAAAMRR
ncbi:hypothetical protein [Microbispora rosea]